MSLIRQNSCFQPTIDTLMHVGSHSFMSKNDMPDPDNIFYTIPLDEEPDFKPLSRGTTITEAETSTAQVEYWVEVVSLAEIDYFQAKQAKQIQWADTLVQAALTYSNSEYDRRGPDMMEWTRMPCSDYEPDDFIDDMAGCGVSEFPEDDEPKTRSTNNSEETNKLLCELMQLYS